MRDEGLLYLFDLRHANALHLTLADTVAEKDDLLWRSATVAFERLNSTRHARLQISGALLADFVLNYAC